MAFIDHVWTAIATFRKLVAPLFQRISAPVDLAPTQALLPPPEIEAVKKPRKPRDTTARELRQDLIERLHEYFPYIRRMKRGDPEAYALYSKLGALLVPEFPNPHHDYFQTLSPFWRQSRPAFGCLALCGGDAEKDGYISPQFLYFHKYTKSPTGIQQCPGSDIYVVTIYHDDRHDKVLKKYGCGAPTEFAVAIDPEGRVSVLRVLLRDTQKVRVKRGRDRGSVISIPQRHWGISPRLREWAKEHKEGVHGFLRNIFMLAAHSYEKRHEQMIEVRAKKDDLCAIFTVDIEKTPWFFADRGRTVNVNGNRRRIFHVVRPHMRERAGKVKAVKMHFRGERAFEWNGLNIEITVPHRDHFQIADFNVGSYDAVDVPAGQDAVGTSVLADRLLALRDRGERRLH